MLESLYWRRFQRFLPLVKSDNKVVVGDNQVLENDEKVVNCDCRVVNGDIKVVLSTGCFCVRLR